MKNYILKISLVLIIIGTAFTSLKAQGEVSEETMANMTALLDLSDVQQGQMGELMNKYRGSIDWILAKYEGEEEPDVKAMIEEIRGERDAYREELQGILSANQYEIYLSKMDQILSDMFRDLAEIRLWDVQPAIALTDKQVVDLTPILAKSMKQTIQLLFDNVKAKMSLPTKVKIKNNMKKIEKEKKAGMENILTPAQMSAYDQYKEEQKEARKNK
jgi:hypothetical protein